MTGIATSLITDLEQLAALEPAWWSLWRRARRATPFQSPSWLMSWWKAFSPGELRVGAAFRHGRLVGLFPFYLERGAHGARLLPIGISISDYLDVLLDEQAIEVGDKLTQQMLEQRWDEWDFEEMTSFGGAAGLACPRGVVEAVSEQSTCPVVALRGGAGLADCVPARRRRQLRRAVKAASRLGEIRISVAEKDPLAFLDILFALHVARWETRHESGVLASAPIRAFHREALPRLAAAGLARCFLLTIDGRAVAAYYGLFDRGRAYAYLGGFDPAFEAISPGSILIGHAITSAIVEGASEFHFLRGREAYKYSWGASNRWNFRRVWTRALLYA